MYLRVRHAFWNVARALGKQVVFDKSQPDYARVSTQQQRRSRKCWIIAGVCFSVVCCVRSLNSRGLLTSASMKCSVDSAYELSKFFKSRNFSDSDAGCLVLESYLGLNRTPNVFWGALKELSIRAIS